MRRPKILTWHVHGSYLYYLSHANVDFYVLSRPDRSPGYAGRHGHFPWGDNVIDIPVSELPGKDFDAILFQSHAHYLNDQHEILSEQQKRLPTIFLEHDPPRESAFDTRHPVDDANALVVHVTHFNRLMWNCGRTPTRVISHGVVVPDGVRYRGDLPRGIVVINHLARRGRRLGEDVYLEMRRRVPLDLVGMGSHESAGGLGEVRHDRLPEFQTGYRLFFNPIRYTSLGLAVCEAMMLGMPVVGLATTEMVTTIENGVSGFVHNDVDRLADVMQTLLNDPMLARQWGDGARRAALDQFSIERFARDWENIFHEVCGRTNIFAVG
jgi:glycosyltransferase involved in cell wall biosynthesis